MCTERNDKGYAPKRIRMTAVVAIFVCSLLLFILLGYPIAFTLGGLSTLFGLYVLGLDFFVLLPSRMMGIMSNQVLMSVPLFIFMGLMLEKSNIASDMLITMGRFMSRVRGGLLIAVVIVGGMLAASTGIVGATVVTMGLISLPTLLDNGYSPKLSSGTVAASGTLGQVVPPSIVLILLASVLNVSVGSLFHAVLVPSMLLIVAYVIYIVLVGLIRPQDVGYYKKESGTENDSLTFPSFREIVFTFFLPFVLIAIVLGSILIGLASPSESAALGALGAGIMSALFGKLSWSSIREVCLRTGKLTSMIFFILLGATTFSLVFRGIDGDMVLRSMLLRFQAEPVFFLIGCLVFIFVLGFFLDFVEIIFVVVPIIMPILSEMGFDMITIGILFAFNLQTSFLTPPFGFSLFYLKGVAPSGVTSRDIYIGSMPFVFIQLVFLVVLFVVLV